MVVGYNSRWCTELLAAASLALAVTAAGCAPPVRAASTASTGAAPVLWRAPLATRPPAIPPRAPFRFVTEDFSGDSPKFTVVDANDRQWKVKLGPEVHTEIPAAVLLSSTGFFVDEMHYLDRAAVSGIERLKRGRESVVNGEVINAQFEARSIEGQSRGATWDWEHNPFAGSAPLDGLRVLMLLINNYDARAANNRIVEVTMPDGQHEARYVVTDLGASFGRYGGLGGHRTKSDLDGYRASRFIDRVQGDDVLFAYRTRPEGPGLALFIFNPFYARGELKKERDLNRVPLSGVRWIAQRLQQLPPGTIRSAFDGVGLSVADAAGFTTVVEERIRTLAAL